MPRTLDLAGKLRRGARWCAVALVAAGLSLAAVLAWEIWGTAIETSRHQDELAEEFRQTTTVPVTETEEFAEATAVRTERGEVLGRIVAPAIGLDAYVVHGTRYRDLVKGPGWVIGTAYPGGPGNAAISGHRTSYGAPFADIHLLEPDDEIILTVGGRTHTYRVTGYTIVHPDQTSVLRTDDWTRSTLTLISCYPKYSSKKRIIVSAEQRDYVAPGTVTEADLASTEQLALGDADDFGDSPYETIRGVIQALIWTLVAVLGLLVVGARFAPSSVSPTAQESAAPEPEDIGIFVLPSPLAPMPSRGEPTHH